MQDKLKNNLYKAIKTLNSNFRKITTPQTPPKTLEPPKITDPKPQPTELQTTKTIIEIKPITAFKTTLLKPNLQKNSPQTTQINL